MRETGAVLVQVAISILVLSAFTAFVLDYGVMWLSRGQAQNAADAGALAGVVARVFDEVADPPTGSGVAYQSAWQAAQSNLVFGSAPAAAVSWTCPGFVDTNGRCARVDVYRDGTNGSSALPVFFARLFGAASMGVRATATAEMTPANATDCARPWAVPDKWTEVRAPVTDFNHYDKAKPLKNPDVYVPPTETSTGTGYTVDADFGTPMTLLFSLWDGSNPIQIGRYIPLDIPRADGTPRANGARYFANITSCNGIVTTIGQRVPTEPSKSVTRNATNTAVASLIAQDPTATWDAATKSVLHSCAPTCAPTSPRIVPLLVYDPDKFQLEYQTYGKKQWPACAAGETCVQIVNILGFFVAGFSAGDMVGYVTKYQSGQRTSSGSLIGHASAFGSVVGLAR